MIIITSKRTVLALIINMTLFLHLIRRAPSIALMALLLATAAVLPFGQALAQSQASPLVGVASLMSGQATATSKSGEVRNIGADTKIFEGDLIETKASTHVYVKTQDQGFISIRPNSKFQIELYQFDARDPAKTQIRWKLVSGVVRVVSGKGMEAARERFRLNTPLVAIGIRGTDFSVFSDAGVTRAFVNTGAVVISPFNEQCSPSGLGACNGVAGLSLVPGDSPLAQFRSGDQRPEFVRSLDLSPDRLVPPRPDEAPTLKSAPSNKAASAPSAPVDPVGQLAGSTSAQTTSNSSAANVASVTNAAPIFSAQTTLVSDNDGKSRVVPLKPSVHWGRWANLLGEVDPTSKNLFGSDRQLEIAFGNYGLARDKGSMSAKPEKGTFSFLLWDHEAVLIDADSAQINPATLQNAELSVDFAKNRFQTKFDFLSGTFETTLSSEGGFSNDGKMTNDTNSSVLIRGVLSGAKADQAGYVFRHQIPSGKGVATGVTRWVR